MLHPLISATYCGFLFMESINYNLKIHLPIAVLERRIQLSEGLISLIVLFCKFNLHSLYVFSFIFTKLFRKYEPAEDDASEDDAYGAALSQATANAIFPSK